MDNYPIKVFPKVDWPQRVNEINKPPEKLFYRGADMSQLPVQTKFLVVVGARKCSEYSKRVCQELIAGLKGYPVIIVSGLALGIDSIAHQAALDTNLTTVAVPGSGLNANVIYPRNHFGLAQNILNAGGTLLSEFDNDFKSTPWCFPQRNRIKAALSHGILIIGARQKSGTMITARLGLDYNREVMTVPHSIFEENGEGPHYLLSQGATPIRESSEILTTLGIAERETTPTSSISLEHLSDPENKLIILLQNCPMEKDDLIRESGLTTSEASIAITTLELQDIIRQRLGKIELKL